METLQSLEKSIITTTKLQGIVKSMKTLAAVSIRQYEKAILSLDTFVQVVEMGLQAALKEISLPGKPSGNSRIRRGLIVFGSDQGLCGRFNERLAELVQQQIQAGSPGGAVERLLVIGARLAGRLESAGFIISEQFWVPGSVSGINFNVYQTLLTLERWIKEHKVYQVDLFYNRHEKATGAQPHHQVLLPLDKQHLSEMGAQTWPGRSLPYYRIPAEDLFSGLIRQYLFVTLFRAQAESLAGEQASRLRSLQNAEKNIEDHVEELRGAYRIKRQASITSELLDLVAGFKATVQPK